MAPSAEPLISRRARADIDRVSRIMQGMLSVWLHRLSTGQVDSDEIHRLLGRKRWRWVEFAGYAIVFRPLSDAEREKRGAALPTLLIGRIVPVAEIARIGKEFLTGAEDGGE
jgi:hypothetical protein